MNKFDMIDEMYHEGITDVETGYIKDKFRSDEYRDALSDAIMVLEYNHGDYDYDEYRHRYDYDDYYYEHITYDNLTDMWFELTGDEWDW